MQNQFRAILYQIESSRNILCLAHRKPDGDGLGCLSAMAEFLIFKQKKFQLFCVDPVPLNYYFLNHLEGITDKINPSEYDLIISLDSSDLNQTGIPEIIKNTKTPVINIDHHEGNSLYGSINVVEKCSSTSEIIYKLFYYAKVEITKKVATALLTGIVFDTNNLTNPAATPESFDIVSSLMRKGANLKGISSSIYKNKNLSALKLWGELLNDLKYNKEYDVASTVVTLEDIKRYGIQESFIEGITNFISSSTNTKVLMVLKEEPNGEIKGSLRTNHESIDVSRLAKFLGGGGHRKAAGFRVQGELVKKENEWKIE